MPINNKYQYYENYDYNTPRRSHYGEGRRTHNRNRDYYDDYNDFEDNSESGYSYADDDENPIYAQPGFSGGQSWGQSRRSGREDDIRNYSRRSFNSQIGERDRSGRPYSTGRTRYGDRYSEPYYDDYEVYHGEDDDGYNARKNWRGKAW